VIAEERADGVVWLTVDRPERLSAALFSPCVATTGS
jgi:hypothetical protein